ACMRHAQPPRTYSLTLPPPPSSSSLLPYTPLFRSGRAADDHPCDRGSSPAADRNRRAARPHPPPAMGCPEARSRFVALRRPRHRDRKSTRLNSSHVKISYAAFCLEKNRLE